MDSQREGENALLKYQTGLADDVMWRGSSPKTPVIPADGAERRADLPRVYHRLTRNPLRLHYYASRLLLQPALVRTVSIVLRAEKRRGCPR